MEKIRKFWGVGIILIAVAVGAVALWWRNEGEIVSPLGKRKEIIKREGELEVVGFLPTWMIGKTQNYGGKVDQLIFLGVEVDEEGTLLWDLQARKINSAEYLKLKKEIRDNGGTNILGIKLFKDKAIDKLLASQEARKKLISEIKTMVEVADFDGVNVDFEDMNDPLRVLSDDFGVFLEEMRAAKMGEISVDVFGNTIIKGDLEAIRGLQTKVEKIIVMAYDFHQAGSDYAGPVAPMGSEAGERNIGEIFQKIIEGQLQKEKYVLAYPLYGYQWRTKTEDLGSETVDNWGRMVSWNEVKERTGDGTYAKFVDFKENWDEVSQTPWVSFKNEETVESYVWVKRKKKKVINKVMRTYQAYFENERSLGIKLARAKEVGVGGVGFWALGYEGMGGGVWEIVEKYSD